MISVNVKWLVNVKLRSSCGAKNAPARLVALVYDWAASPSLMRRPRQRRPAQPQAASGPLATPRLQRGPGLSGHGPDDNTSSTRRRIPESGRVVPCHLGPEVIQAQAPVSRDLLRGYLR